MEGIGYVATAHEDAQILHLTVVLQDLLRVLLLQVHHLNRVENASKLGEESTAVQASGAGVDEDENGRVGRGDGEDPAPVLGALDAVEVVRDVGSSRLGGIPRETRAAFSSRRRRVPWCFCCL